MLSLTDFWYHLAGHVGPDELAKIKADNAKDIATASAGADPAVIKERQRQAATQIDGTLTTFPGGSAHPADKDVTGAALVMLKKYVNIALATGAILGVLYFGVSFARVLKTARG